MSCQEGALLIGQHRAPPTIKHPQSKPRPTQQATDSVSFDNLELCFGQTSDVAVEALTYYFTHMVSLLSDSFSATQPKELVLTGIITSVPDQLENEEFAAWEFLPIDNISDVDSVTATIRELLKNNDKLETILLYPKELQRYTGVYPGVVVRILGMPFKFDVDGAPTAVGLSNIAFPCRPPYRWGAANVSESSNPTPARIHFVSGPFTREIFTPITQAIKSAALRGACALVVYGPFVSEKDSNHQKGTFDDTLNLMLDEVETAMALPEVSASLLACVYFVPSLKDVNNYPVLPQPKFSIMDDEKYKVVSNPTTLSIGGITILCSNFASVEAVAQVMADKWTDKHKLLRAGECVLRERLAAPLLSFPPKHHDLKSLHSMAIMDDLEMSPPHVVVFTSQRDQSMAFISHSDRLDLSDPQGDGAVVITLGTTGRKIVDSQYNFQAVELTVPDVLAAATGGLGGRSTVTILNQTCYVPL